MLFRSPSKSLNVAAKPIDQIPMEDSVILSASLYFIGSASIAFVPSFIPTAETPEAAMPTMAKAKIAPVHSAIILMLMTSICFVDVGSSTIH